MGDHRFKAALIQMDSQADEKENLIQAQRYLEKAAREGIKLAVFPETMDYIGEDFKAHAKKVPGEISQFFAREARKYGIYIHCGSITVKNQKGNPYNTSLFFLPNGKILGQYSKIHMFDVEIEDGPACQESATICAGDEIILMHTELAVFGMAICYDLRFPEMFKVMAQNGAQVMILPSNFTKTTGEAHWEALLRARAIENTCYVLACGQCGEKRTFTAHGNSMIISPWGEILTRADNKPGYIAAEIDLDYLANVRAEIPSLSNVRKDIYSLICEKVYVFKE